MEDFKPNSHKYREGNALPEKKVEKVISGGVRSKKKSEFHKFADVFVSEDATNVKNYILMDVLVPSVKKAISEVIVNGVDMLLYGETGHSKRGSSSKVSYRSYYDRNERPAYNSNRSRVGYDYNDIILDSRGDAEAVLASLDDLIDTYGVVSVADLYDLVGVTGDYTDNKYGWTDIRNATVVHVRDGYLIKMPRALPLS